MPLRLTLGRRMLGQGAVEVRLRDTATGGESRQVPLADAVAHVRDELARLRGEIMARVHPADGGPEPA